MRHRASGGLLGGKDPPTAFSVVPCGSNLSEPAVELPVVVAIHVAVAVEVEIPQVPGLARVLRERRPEEVTIKAIDVPVAIAVAKQPADLVHAIAARATVVVAVQFPPPAVMGTIRPDRQGVTTFGKRAANEFGPGDGESGHGPSVLQG